MADTWTQRFDGTPGRLDVWYATFTEPATKAGLWVHGETVAPDDGGAVERLGWVAVFPEDGPPRWARTGRSAGPLPEGARTFECDGLQLGPDGTSGQAGDISWDLAWDSTEQRTLYTFPKWAWQRELLPGSQVVPAPSLDVTGKVSSGGSPITFDGARGNVARIYGHGNAERWAWLHADLGGGDVLEMVTAVSTRPGLNRLAPITHLRFRIDGKDWPGLDGPSFRLKSRIGLPTWEVSGRVGRATLSVTVYQPTDRSVAIDYHDPDGRSATCTNTEQADVDIELKNGPGGGRFWHLEGTGHAEVGSRP